MTTPDPNRTAWLEAQRREFREWWRREFRGLSIYSDQAIAAEAAWLAARSMPVVTEEMCIHGAWAPINEAMADRGIEPFHPGNRPSKPEIERARLIITAALSGSAGEGKP